MELKFDNCETMAGCMDSEADRLFRRAHGFYALQLGLDKTKDPMVVRFCQCEMDNGERGSAFPSVVVDEENISALAEEMRGRRVWPVRLSPAATLGEVINTLAHEMVHVEQMASGRLVDEMDARGKYKRTLYDGKEYKRVKRRPRTKDDVLGLLGKAVSEALEKGGVEGVSVDGPTLQSMGESHSDWVARQRAQPWEVEAYARTPGLYEAFLQTLPREDLVVLLQHERLDQK